MMDKKAIRKIARKLMDKDIKVIAPPESGFIMMTVKDSFGTGFHLGEVLVTRAEVEVDGERGYAMAMGGDHAKVMMIAVINAVLKTGDRARIIGKIKTEERKLVKKIDEERALIASTRVSFEVMP
ncbi:MAG: phosphonate C-P lyase system protein PhnG [Syntrophales bacterium]|nr:phosphonate C-P lyase system protein PhnG [Syntrophales bacterium]